MTYATATYLLNQFAADEIAQRADRGIPRLVSAEMLAVAATGGDMSGYTAEERAAADAALALINSKLADADSVIDGYLLSRYTLPLPVVPRLVMSVACDLARYALYDDVATEQITDRYRAAIKMLDAIAAGKLSLGANDSQVPAQAATGVNYSAPARVFNDNSLGGY